MSVNNLDDYKIFAMSMVNLTPEQRRDNSLVIRICMKASGGRMDPSMISEWFQMWHIAVAAQISRFMGLHREDTIPHETEYRV